MKKLQHKIAFIFVFAMICQANAQSLKHPIIYATLEERPRILELIDNQDWAKSIVSQMRSNVDPKLTTHQTNPDAITNNLPAFPDSDDNTEALANPFATAHNKVLTTASYSAMLYFITNDEKYASFSADIIAHYVTLLESKTTENATISGNYFYDPRTVFTHFALTYDFIYNYLKKTGTTVYDKTSKKRVPFNNEKAQLALLNIAGNSLDEAGGYETNGRFISNHHILTAPGSLFPILCIEDDTQRERLFNVFWERGTRRQSSFKNTVLPMFGEQGIWPESLSYSFMPNVSMILNVVDRIKPNLNIYSQAKDIFEGIFLFENLRNPDRSFVRYGDSKREIDATDDNYRFALTMAKKQKVINLQSKAELALKQLYDANGGYKPTLPSSIFDNYAPLELFWGEILPASSVEKYEYKPTVIVKHAGLALQRNHVENKNSLYGLCGIIGGAHYVHSHATGIAMELYGAEYVMGPNGGLPPSVADRSLPEHRQYFMRHGGNNTVIVNGTSQGRQSGSWASNISIWQNTTINVAAEPKNLEDPISNKFSFATQFLKDGVNNCDQQRTLGIIRTSETSAYYFDMFRSKSLGANNFHDYIYHNLGDETQLVNAQNQVLTLTNTSRYATDVGDLVKSPGWTLLENTQASAPTSDGVKIRFKINFNNRYMHMFVPAGVSREYTKALGPPTREANNGYVNKKTQVVAIRQSGEAWERPFVAVFEPNLKEQSSVQSVEQILVNSAVIGAIVKSELDGKTITDYIICNESDINEINLPELKLAFKGRYGIVRKEVIENKSEITLYIGEGTQLDFEGNSLKADAQKKGVASFRGVVLGTEEDSGTTFEVFPNPSDSQISIKINELNWKKLSVYNINGQRVFENTSGNNIVELDQKQLRLQPGVYIVELIDKKDKRKSKRIILK